VGPIAVSFRSNCSGFYGVCRAAMVFRTQVLPILQAGGLECVVHETKHRGHATEIVKKLQSAACDAIVGVGGDGTIFEILQVDLYNTMLHE
jgi:diacylglycerol kinase family enzyme